MQLTTLLTAAGLAVSTSHAFLVPLPEHFPEADDIVTTLPVPVKIETEMDVTKVDISAESDFRRVLLDCPGCPVPVRGFNFASDGEPPVRTDIPSHLELNFTVVHGKDSDRLLANGFQLYPMREPLAIMGDRFPGRLLPEFPHHRQDKKRPEHKQRHKHHRNRFVDLGHGLRVQNIAHSNDDNLDLIQLDLDIIEVGRAFVTLPHVQVKLIKTPAGGLMIGPVDITPAEPPKSLEACTTLICRWRAIIMQQVRRLRFGKPCGGRPGVAGHGRPAGGNMDGMGHHHKMHPHHKHHGHRASWVHLLKNIASHILLPVAIGVVAGVAASVLGMMVGTVVVCLWRTFFRPASRRHHHRRHSCHHKAAKREVAAAADEEKSGLMANQEEEDVDAPPAYADDKKPETEV